MHELGGQLALVVMERVERRVVVQRDGAGVGVHAPEAQGGFLSHSELVDAAFSAGQGTCCCVGCAALHVGVGRCHWRG